MIKLGEVLNDQITDSNSHLCAERYQSLIYMITFEVEFTEW